MPGRARYNNAFLITIENNLFMLNISMNKNNYVHIIQSLWIQIIRVYKDVAMKLIKRSDDIR